MLRMKRNLIYEQSLCNFFISHCSKKKVLAYNVIRDILNFKNEENLEIV